MNTVAFGLASQAQAKNESMRRQSFTRNRCAGREIQGGEPTSRPRAYND